MITLTALAILVTSLLAARILARKHGDQRTLSERIVCGLFAYAHWCFRVACAADKALVEYRRQATAEVPQPECLEAR